MPADYRDTFALSMDESPAIQEQQFRDLLTRMGGPERWNYSEQLRTIMRQIALETFAPRIAAITEQLLANQRAAAGSPQELFAQFGAQINQIQQGLQRQIQTINRQGGLGMGGQRKAAQGQAVGTALAQYQNYMQQNILGGRKGLFGISSNIRPSTSTNIPLPNISQQQLPPDYGAYAQSAYQIGSGAAQLYNAPQTQHAFNWGTSTAGMTPITPGTPMAANPAYLPPPQVNWTNY